MPTKQSRYFVFPNKLFGWIATLTPFARNEMMRHPELVWLLLPKSSDFVQNVPYRAGSINSLFPSLGREGVGMGFSPKVEPMIKTLLNPPYSGRTSLRHPEALAEGSLEAKNNTPLLSESACKIGIGVKKKAAFTLSELLLSLIIVGVIAIITVPTLINNVQKKLFATQVKNFVAEIEQLAQDELIAHRTRDLSNTDFGDPEKLLSDKHFSIVKSCSASTSLKDCWKTTATGKDKVIYKLINGTKVNSFTGAVKTIVLGNGALLHYDIEKRFSNRAFAYFVIDINGNDPPNISGRDAFAFYIDKKGHIKDPFEVTGQSNSTSQKLNLCTKTGGNYAHWYCPGLLLDNNWKMDY